MRRVLAASMQERFNVRRRKRMALLRGKPQKPTGPKQVSSNQRNGQPVVQNCPVFGGTSQQIEANGLGPLLLLIMFGVAGAIPDPMRRHEIQQLTCLAESVVL